MKKLILALCLISCSSYSQSIRSAPNSCLINSIRVYENLNKEFNNKNIWNNVLIMTFKERVSRNRYAEGGHAITIFYWNNQYFAYDVNQGSKLLNSTEDLKNNPIKAAKLACPYLQIRSAKYLVNK